MGWIVGAGLLGLNALAGWLVGSQFPLAMALYQQRSETESAAGVLYGADLFGAMGAALLVSAVFLPALGIVQSCLLLALLKAGSLSWALLLRAPRSGQA